MADLDKLIVRIEADLSDLKRGMADANKQVNQSSSKIKGSLQKMGNDFDAVGKRVIKFGSIFAGAFGVLAIKSVADVGVQIENLQVRLKALFGSAQEGARAFDNMVEFASKVPFTLADIQQASGNLAVVSDDADHLSELLEITGNVASATGLDFRTTAEQIQRAFAGGIASADIFRERGVRAMLGFQAGATVSVDETIKRFREVFMEGGEFGNVTKDFAKTLTGTISMLQDKLFQFQKAIADEFFSELKLAFGDLNESLESNKHAIQDFGRDIGLALADITRAIVDNIDIIIASVKALGVAIGILVTVSIGKFIKGLSLLKKALVGVGAVLSLVLDAFEEEITISEEVIKQNDKMAEGQELLAKMTAKAEAEQRKKNKTDQDQLKLLEKIEKQLKKNIDAMKEFNDQQLESLELRNQMQNKELLDFFESLESAVERAGESISEAFARAVVKGEDFGQAMKNIFQQLLIEIVKVTVQILVIDKLMEALKRKLNDIKNSSTGTASLMGSIGSMSFAPSPSVMSSPTFIPSMVGGSSGGGGVTVNQSLNISTGVNQTVRAEIMNMMPDIKQETLGAVAEARSRGGSFARTFGA